MDELANEQLLLMEIKDKLCDGNGAELARRIGKDPTYVNRLFYPRSKPGAKGIGREIMLACNKAFGLPIGFWDVSYPALDPQVVNLIRARMLLRPEGAELQPVGRIGEKLPITGNAASAEEPHASYGMTPILAWEHQDDLPDGDFVMIPRLDVHLSAGGGREQVEIGLTKDNPQAFRTEWIRQQRLRPNRLAAMRAAGESMEPTIHDGDSLLVDTSQTTVVDGKVYALWYDGGERVKRLFRLPGGGLRIKSDNPQHPTIEVGANHHEHVRIIGRVVHRSGIGGL